MFSLYPEFLNPSTLTFHSLLGFDLLSSIPSPPQLPNSSGMHLRNVLREEELPGRRTWERGGCCSSIKLEGQGSRVCRPEQDQETSIHPACALFFSIRPSALPWVLIYCLASPHPLRAVQASTQDQPGSERRHDSTPLSGSQQRLPSWRKKGHPCFRRKWRETCAILA